MGFSYSSAVYNRLDNVLDKNKVNKRGAILLLSLIISIQLCISAPFFAEEMILNQMLLVFFLQLLIKKNKIPVTVSKRWILNDICLKSHSFSEVQRNFVSKP